MQAPFLDKRRQNFYACYPKNVVHDMHNKLSKVLIICKCKNIICSKKDEDMKAKILRKKTRTRLGALAMSGCILFTGFGSNGQVVFARTNGESTVSEQSVSQENTDSATLIEDADAAGVYYNSASGMTDFRDETIYFVMTTRFYDGDSSNNVQCWDAQALNQNDPPWRGDFKGLIEKLDYIKALGFTAIWITPVVENASGYDYHGYHAFDFSKVDSRYESEGVTYEDFINAAHAKGMKVIQDVVFNHTGNWGEKNLHPIASKDYSQDLSDCEASMIPDYNYNWNMNGTYTSLEPTPQFQVRTNLIMNGANDTENIYHHNNFIKGWETYDEQVTSIDGDCMDLNTENPKVYHYLVDCYSKYIEMGVDAFRVDTVKHVSRLTFNQAFVSQLNDAYNQVHGTTGEGNFYMFGEACTRVRDIWNKDIPALSAPFFTWKEETEYAWDDSETDAAIETNSASVKQAFEDNKSVNNEPTSNNAFLNGNTYHTPDYSKASGLNVIDFPMHWNFATAREAFSVALKGDQYYNDATYNVTYVDSHDYAPDGAPENQRFAGTQAQWAENLSLMFTFRGIPCIYYGSEVEFQKGKRIDAGTTMALADTGRAYFGDYIEGSVDVADFGRYTNATGTMAETLNYPLSLHIQRLNRLRAAIPALRKGQYSTTDCSGSGMAFKRRYTDSTTDSFALVTISGDATFNNLPGGTYVDAITGDTKTIDQGGSISTSGVTKQGDLRVYVLDTELTKAPGMIDGYSKFMSGGCDLNINVVAPTGVTLDKTSAELDLGDTVTFTATVAPADATNKSVSWASSDASVATVSNGKVTAKGEGKATITATTSNGIKATATVTVEAKGVKVTSVTLDKSSVTLEAGQTAQVTATVAPANAEPKYAVLSWTSSNKNVATVSNEGLITALTKGTTTITAETASGVSATMQVTVNGVKIYGNAIYFEKPSGWGSNIKAYFWTGSGEWTNAAWPGAAMTEVEDGVYGIEWPEGKENETLNVIFNDGSSKTDDLIAKINGYFNESGYVKDVPVNDKPEEGVNIQVSFADANAVYTYDGTQQKPKVIVKADDTVLTENTDYTLSYQNNVNACDKTADASAPTVTVTGMGDYVNSIPADSILLFTIEPKTLSDSNVSVTGTYTYTGAEVKPEVTVTDTAPITSGDYSVSYSNNVNAGKATITVTGKGNYTGEVKKDFTISPKTLTDANVKDITESYVYTGAEIKPEITVTDTATITPNDYSVSYSNNVNAGNATITITGSSNYAGTVSKTFTISKAELPKNAPTDRVVPANTKLSEVPLSEGWTWSAADANKEVEANKTVEVTAEYTGADAANYKTVSVTIKVTGTSCTHNGDIEVKNVVKESCTADGYSGDEYCKECGAVITPGNVIPKTGHSWDAGTVTIEPTEVTAGIKTYTCTNCSEIKTEVLQPIPGHVHTWDAGMVTKQPTETTEGERTYHCTVDGCTETKREDIPKLAHTNHIWDDGTVTKQPTETTEGERTYHCTVDGCTETDIKPVPKLNHTEHIWDNGTVTKEATETEAGVKTYHCTAENCTETKTEDIPKLAHTNHIWDNGTVTIQPTETEKGVKTYKCTVTGCTETKTEDIPKLAHTNHIWDNGTVTIQPTETEKGVKTFKCTVTGCTETKTEDIPKLAHTNHIWDAGTVTKQPTETEKGVKTYKCTVTGCTETKTEDIPKLAHTAHKWDNGTVTKQPTETTEGVKTYKCTVTGCTETKTERISATGKQPSTPQTKNPQTPEGTIETPGKTVEEGDIVKDSVTTTSYRITKSTNSTKTVEWVITNDKEETVEVPDKVTINGEEYKVTSIADQAFKNKKTLKKVVIGSNVKTIGENAFSGCKNLQEVKLDANLTTIGEKAFYKCTSLTKVAVPSKVSKIGKNAFYGCKSLEKVTLGAKVTTINEKAFYKCTSLTTIVIPDKVNKIGKQAFYGCKNLKSITIKTSKLTDKKVGSKAFKGIASKATIKVPKKKLDAYTKLLTNKGVSSKATIKK